MSSYLYHCEQHIQRGRVTNISDSDGDVVFSWGTRSSAFLVCDHAISGMTTLSTVQSERCLLQPELCILRPELTTSLAIVDQSGISSNPSYADIYDPSPFIKKNTAFTHNPDRQKLHPASRLIAVINYGIAVFHKKFPTVARQPAPGLSTFRLG